MTDEATLRWRCRCGAIEGTLRHRAGERFFHAVCHCRDCRAFQHVLGRAEETLDAHGGTAILGVSPAAFAVERGRERLALLRLTPKGLLRWYAGCCDTPIGNTSPVPLVPHLGLVTAGLTDANPDGAIEAVYGPVRFRLHGRSATNGAAPGAHPGVPPMMFPQGIAMFAARWWRGEHRRNPFFDGSGAPCATPRVLTEAEHDALPPYRDATRQDSG